VLCFLLLGVRPAKLTPMRWWPALCHHPARKREAVSRFSNVYKGLHSVYLPALRLVGHAVARLARSSDRPLREPLIKLHGASFWRRFSPSGRGCATLLAIPETADRLHFGSIPRA